MTRKEWAEIMDIENVFPIGVFNNELKNYFQELKKSLDYPLDVTATTFLTLIGVINGSTIKLEVKPGWEEASILWSVVVGVHGSGKSHPVKNIVKPLTQIDKERNIEYKKDKQDWEEEQAEAKKNKTPGVKKPHLAQTIIKDTTIEGLYLAHEHNAKGLLIYVDELEGFFQSMNQYRSGGGGDEQKYLSLYNGEEIVVNRASSETKRIDQSHVCITGTIQPHILLSTINKENGLSQRFLFTKLRRKKVLINKNRMSRDRFTYYNKLIRNFKEESDKHAPQMLELDDECFSEFMNTSNLVINLGASEWSNDKFRGYTSKMAGCFARLILVMFFIDKVLFDENKIKLAHVKRASELTMYYVRSAYEIYEDSKRDMDKQATLKGTEKMTRKEKIIHFGKKGYKHRVISELCEVTQSHVSKTLRDSQLTKKTTKNN